MNTLNPEITLIQHIAGFLDYPSIFMGGPSKTNMMKAAEIIQICMDEGFISEEDIPVDPKELVRSF